MTLPVPTCGVPVGGNAACPCACPSGHAGHHKSAARIALDAHQKRQRSRKHDARLASTLSDSAQNFRR
jgi:hypothetical protein